MIVFCAQSAAHLKPLLSLPMGSYLYKTFTDGELYIRLETEVARQDVWIVAATNAPAEHLIELLMLIDALKRAGARIKLLLTYFGYARQDRPLPGEASSAQVMGKILSLDALEKIVIIHAHSMTLHEYFSFENVIPVDLICQTAALYDAIAAPDQGAFELVKGICKTCLLEPIYLTKIRPEQETVEILEYDGIVNAKRILIIDDIIATGNTIIEVAKKLRTLGAQEIMVWATHGIFSANALQAIEKSEIHKVYVTNTLPQKRNSLKLEVINIAPFLTSIMQNL